MFLASSLLMIPLCYLLVLKVKVCSLFEKEENKNYADVIKSIAIFITTGLFYLTAICITDTFAFLVSLFRRDLQLRDPKTENDDIISSFDSDFLEFFIMLLKVSINRNELALLKINMEK